jgi:outer membrane protein assembly factor BamB
VKRLAPPVAALALAVACVTVLLGGAASAKRRPARHKRPPTANYHYDTPVQQSSPWPTMRHDRFNTGASPILGVYHGDQPWAFHTGKGIFSTPVVGGDATIYFGSADTYFYAVSPRGKLRWRFKTGNLIDSAGFIGRYNARLRTYPVAVPSGDTHLYLIRSNARRMSRKRRIIWKYTPPAGQGAEGQLVNWWEGNAEPGPNGTIYAGNTGDAAFAINPNGTLKWVHRSIGPFWTDPAITSNNTTYWGSLDLQVHGFDANGNQQWTYPTLGFVVSSPALDHTGTLYIGSFDSNLYALNAATGVLKWKFATGDHIYSSPALDEDAQGHLRAIYVGSTDGQLYALSPSGHLLWSYDTGDVIRSSPVVGFAPDGVHKIVYVGAGNGTLYAINASDGTRRWSFQTTRSNPVLHDRNDLNGSPALTKTGVVIGGEDGYLKYVPYDYCLHHRDSRCSTSPGSVFAPELDRVYPVTAGGNTQLAGGVQTIGAATALPERLVVRTHNQTLDASMQPLPSAASIVHVSPSFGFTAELSGDGHYVFIEPNGLLTPGRDYTVHLSGTYTANGISVGNLHIGGTTAGTFGQTIQYRVRPARTQLSFRIGRRKTTAMRLTRLAFPLPAFLTSVNQIGFDAYNLLVGAIASTPSSAGRPGSVLMWAIGAKAGAHGTQEADPSTTLAFPMQGPYSGDSIALSAHNVTLTFSFGPVPVQRLELRAQLSHNLTALPGASIYGEVQCLSVPTYGPILPTQRLCNNEGKLVASGTFVTGPYPRGIANRRPHGVAVTSVSLQRPSAGSAGYVRAALSLRRHASYPARNHLAAILLVDAASGAPVGLDYRSNTIDRTNSRGNIDQVQLTIPAGTTLPTHVRAYVISDVYPLTSRVF